MQPEELAGIALDAARLAAAVHREQLGTLDVAEWDVKGAADFVSRVDLEAEQVLVDHIRRCCPGHEIMAEESTRLERPADVTARFDQAEHLWLVDPLDGTTNYLHGYPAYSASVAVAVGGEIVAGAVVDSAQDVEWWAWRGGGAWRGGDRLEVSPVEVSRISSMDRALIGTGFPFKRLDRLPEYLGQFDSVLRCTSGIRRGGSAAIDLCHVADGRFEGFWELWLAPWDVAAGTLIVREAGGVVTSFAGDPDVRAGGSIVAGTPEIHGRLLPLLRDSALRVESENPAARRV
jgi:myo-inositol-1(or 4)-monophosphatase